MTVTERVVYLKGLINGMELDADKKEGRLWTAVLSVMEELAEAVVELQQQNAELAEELDDVYEELSAVEEEFLDEDEFGSDGSLYQVICPTCDEVIYMDDEMLAEGSTVCPACGEELEFDLSGLEDDEIAAEADLPSVVTDGFPESE